MKDYYKQNKLLSHYQDEGNEPEEGQNIGLEGEYRKQKSCFEAHLCVGIFENQFARLQKFEELDEYDVAYLSEGKESE